MITPAKLGWMAAIIDLRGRVYVKANATRATRQITLQVLSKETRVVQEMCRLTGVKAEANVSRPLKDFMRRGCAEHCPEQHVHVSDAADERVMPETRKWVVTGVAMAVVINAIKPYMAFDHDWDGYVDEIMSNVDIQGRGGRAVATVVNRLITLGWPMPERVMELLEKEAMAAMAWHHGEEETEEAV
jgi:hypothetical protein